MAKRKSTELVIDESTPRDLLFLPKVGGELKGRGLVPRDYAQYPQDMFDPPSALNLIPRSEWPDRIKEQEAQESRISDVLKRTGIPSMDQGPNGYCWSHSTVGALQAVRASMNLPYTPLSAYMVAAIIKGGRNEGGWCGLSAKFLREVGVCSQKLWPQGERDVRRLDTPEARADAARRKVMEEYVDLTREVWSQNLVFDVVATCLLSGIPVAGDFNWWAHSVLLCDLVEVEPGSFGIRFRNSWGDDWEEGVKGFAVLRGQRAITDGAVALRSTSASPI